MKGRAVLAAAVAAFAIAPASALAADPPEGAAMSDNLDYVTRVAGARGITEGKFDRVRGDDVLVVTGRFGFKTYDVSDPEDPQELDTFLPDELAEFGYWQDEDMELDTRRKLIIGALDPRHNDVPLGDCTGSSATNPTDGRRVRDPDCMSGFYVISYADPANLRADRRVRVAARRPHRQLHPEAAATSGPAARRGAPTRTGSARSSSPPIRGRAGGSSATGARSG